MPGGPLFPYSSIPITSDRVFTNVHVCAGTNVTRIRGMGVQASLGADSYWDLLFQLPPLLPAGTCKLNLIALAAATSNAAKINPSWASVAIGEDPSAATLNAEGTSTLTWAAGDSDKFKQVKITLDADTPVAGEIITMRLNFETASWTLAVVSTWYAAIIWE